MSNLRLKTQIAELYRLATPSLSYVVPSMPRHPLTTKLQRNPTDGRAPLPAALALKNKVVQYMQQAAVHDQRENEAAGEIGHVGSSVEGSSTGSRIFVGFVSRFFYRHSILKLMEGMISRLRRTRFYVVIFVIAPPSDAEIHHVSDGKTTYMCLYSLSDVNNC